MGRLDDIDKEVISRLQVNGRATLKRIGEGLGLTSMGIKKRMDKLLKQGFIKISASLNLEARPPRSLDLPRG
jgi:DNA-binding Lrp family transcriptional regulator